MMNGMMFVISKCWGKGTAEGNGINNGDAAKENFLGFGHV